MAAGARTPEELDELLEDAFVLRDSTVLEALFHAGAVIAERGGLQARGHDAISRGLAELWERGCTYVARTRRVLQTHETALVVADAGIHVLRRDSDGGMAGGDLLARGDTSPTGGRHDRADAATRSRGDARRRRRGTVVGRRPRRDQGDRRADRRLLSIIEITDPPNIEAPLHVHHREDEGFWILEGDATFEVGDTTIEAHAGDFVWGPRGVPHRYSTGDAGCRMLFVMTPGGFEDLVRGMSTPAQSRTLPPPSDEEPDWEHVAAVAKANGCELLQ